MNMNVCYIFPKFAHSDREKKPMDHAYHIYFGCRTIELLGPSHISFGYLICRLSTYISCKIKMNIIQQKKAYQLNYFGRVSNNNIKLELLFYELRNIVDLEYVFSAVEEEMKQVLTCSDDQFCLCTIHYKLAPATGARPVEQVGSPGGIAARLTGPPGEL